MVSLKFQKRLAASVLKCGRGKVWLDPNESNEIAMANSREYNCVHDTSVVMEFATVLLRHGSLSEKQVTAPRRNYYRRFVILTVYLDFRCSMLGGRCMGNYGETGRRSRPRTVSSCLSSCSSVLLPHV